MEGAPERGSGSRHVTGTSAPLLVLSRPSVTVWCAACKQLDSSAASTNLPLHPFIGFSVIHLYLQLLTRLLLLLLMLTSQGCAGA